MKPCSRCGLENDDTAIECRSCGGTFHNPLSTSPYQPAFETKMPCATVSDDELLKICPQCGHANKSGSVMCTDCSHSLTNVQLSSENAILAEKAAAQEKRDRRYDMLRVVIIAVCVLLSIFSFGMLFFTKNFIPLYAILFFGSGALAIAFPDLDFKWRIMFIANYAEPSEFYYTMNYIGAGLSIVFGFVVLFAGIFINT